MTPHNWPTDAPDYNSLAGWEFEKTRAYNKLRLKLRDHKCVVIMAKCAEMEDAALAAIDTILFCRYHAIWMRCFEWRLQIAGKERVL